MRRILPLVMLGAALVACAPPAAFDPNYQPAPSDLGPKNAGIEWWYVSGYLPQSGVAFHWAQFKVNYRGVPYTASHLAVTDLKANTLSFTEKTDGLATYRFPPLQIGQGDWTLGEGNGRYRLSAGPLDLTLTPLKNPVVHPPGYSGTAETGRLYYQSITRLALSGTANGKPISGLAWMDHQWGDQTPGRQALWDWFGLHLSNDVDLMVYRVKNVDGKVVQLAGSYVDPRGVAHEVTNFTATPRETWTSPTGRKYVLSWDLKSDQFALKVDAVRKEQELLSKSTFVAYWEGPVAGEGSWGDQSVKAEGMGEFVGGALGSAPR